jgi:hypothetical protein
MKKPYSLSKIILIFFLFTIPYTITGQPGKIVFPATASTSALNPDGNFWTTKTSSPFLLNEEIESELNWQHVFQLENEPTGDNSPGGPCGIDDIVDVFGLQKAAYYTIVNPDSSVSLSGDEYFCFRLRTGSNPNPATFGFSVLIDIDNAFSNDGKCEYDDTNAVVGNMGFEVEIRVVNGGGVKGVYLDDVNGLIAGINREIYSLKTNSLISEALYGNGCTTPIFYDFSIPFSDLATWFNMDLQTPVRMAFMTTVNGQTGLANFSSDIGGIDDAKYLNDDEGLIDLICGHIASPLPVELLDFNVKNQNSRIHINWSTLTEINNDYFIVEKSKDAIIWNEIEKVNGAGNSNQILTYKIIDPIPFNGINYYRLRQVDFDGTTSFSKITSINYINEEEISFFPNPATNTLFFNKPPDSVLIYDTKGKLVLHTSNLQNQVDLGNLSQGLYVLNIINNTNTNNYKLIIQ